MATQNPWDNDPVIRPAPQSSQRQQAAPWENDPIIQPPPNRQTAPQAQQRPAPRQAPVAQPQAAPATVPQGYFDQAIYDSFVGAGFAPEEATRFASDPTYMGSDEVGPESDYFEQPDLPVAEAAPQTALGTQSNPIDLSNLTDETVPLLTQGTWVRNGDEVYELPGDAFTSPARQSDQPLSGNAFLRRPNMQDQVGAFVGAASEQIPFLDESIAGTAGLLTGRGYDATRETQRNAAELLNQTNRGSRVAGGVAGFATSLLAPGGAYIGRGANAGQRALRASGVSGAYGGLYGAGAADDSYASRLSGLGQGAVVGAASGGLIQMGADRVRSGITTSISNPSRVRRLSRAGVNMTPGQLLADVPVVGDLARMGEDVAAGYIPFVQGGRNRAAQDFQISTLNQGLREIGEELPMPSRTVGRSGETGYEAVNQAREIFNRAYEAIVPRLRIRGDQGLSDDLAAVVARAEDELISDAPRAQLGRLLGAGVIGRMRTEGSDVVLSNQEFQRADQRLRRVVDRIRSNRNAGPDDDLYADLVDEARSAIREALARQNPPVADDLRAINRGYAQYKLAEQAASGSGPMGRDGVATPREFSQAVASNANRSQSGTGRALGQDLARAGSGVLPARMGDTGSGQRALIGAAVAGGGLLVAPQVAAPVILASMAYSRPAQSILNGIYRGFDPADPGGSQRLLAQLAELTRRNPALQPYYLDAARHVGATLGQGVGGSPPAQPAVQNQAPAQRQAG